MFVQELEREAEHLVREFIRLQVAPYLSRNARNGTTASPSRDVRCAAMSAKLLARNRGVARVPRFRTGHHQSSLTMPRLWSTDILELQVKSATVREKSSRGEAPMNEQNTCSTIRRSASP